MSSPSPSSSDVLVKMFIDGLQVGQLPLFVVTKTGPFRLGHVSLEPERVAHALRILALDHHGNDLYEPVKQAVGDEWTSTGEEATRELDEILSYIEEQQLPDAFWALWTASLSGVATALVATLKAARLGRIRRCAIDRRRFVSTAAQRDYCSKECAIAGKKKADARRSRAEDMKRSRANKRRLALNDYNRLVQQQQKRGVARNGVSPHQFAAHFDNPAAIAELADRVGNLALAKKAKTVSRYRTNQQKTGSRNS